MKVFLPKYGSAYWYRAVDNERTSKVSKALLKDVERVLDKASKDVFRLKLGVTSADGTEPYATIGVKPVSNLPSAARVQAYSALTLHQLFLSEFAGRRGYEWIQMEPCDAETVKSKYPLLISAYGSVEYNPEKGSDGVDWTTATGRFEYGSCLKNMKVRQFVFGDEPAVSKDSKAEKQPEDEKRAGRAHSGKQQGKDKTTGLIGLLRAVSEGFSHGYYASSELKGLVMVANSMVADSEVQSALLADPSPASVLIEAAIYWLVGIMALFNVTTMDKVSVGTTLKASSHDLKVADAASIRSLFLAYLQHKKVLANAALVKQFLGGTTKDARSAIRLNKYGTAWEYQYDEQLTSLSRFCVGMMMRRVVDESDDSLHVKAFLANVRALYLPLLWTRELYLSNDNLDAFDKQKLANIPESLAALSDVVVQDTNPDESKASWWVPAAGFSYSWDPTSSGVTLQAALESDASVMAEWNEFMTSYFTETEEYVPLIRLRTYQHKTRGRETADYFSFRSRWGTKTEYVLKSTQKTLSGEDVLNKYDIIEGSSSHTTTPRNTYEGLQKVESWRKQAVRGAEHLPFYGNYGLTEAEERLLLRTFARAQVVSTDPSGFESQVTFRLDGYELVPSSYDPGTLLLEYSKNATGVQAASDKVRVSAGMAATAIYHSNLAGVRDPLAWVLSLPAQDYEDNWVNREAEAYFRLLRRLSVEASSEDGVYLPEGCLLRVERPHVANVPVFGDTEGETVPLYKNLVNYMASTLLPLPEGGTPITFFRKTSRHVTVRVPLRAVDLDISYLATLSHDEATSVVPGAFVDPSDTKLGLRSGVTLSPAEELGHKSWLDVPQWTLTVVLDLYKDVVFNPSLIALGSSDRDTVELLFGAPLHRLPVVRPNSTVRASLATPGHHPSLGLWQDGSPWPQDVTGLLSLIVHNWLAYVRFVTNEGVISPDGGTLDDWKTARSKEIKQQSKVIRDTIREFLDLSGRMTDLGFAGTTRWSECLDALNQMEQHLDKDPVTWTDDVFGKVFEMFFVAYKSWDIGVVHLPSPLPSDSILKALLYAAFRGESLPSCAMNFSSGIKSSVVRDLSNRKVLTNEGAQYADQILSTAVSLYLASIFIELYSIGDKDA